MKKAGWPKFQGLRIYLTSSILYLFLVLPFIAFLVLQNLPETLSENQVFNSNKHKNSDTLYVGEDSVFIPNIDSLVKDIEIKVDAIDVNSIENADSVKASIEEDVVGLNVDGGHDNNPSLKRFLSLYFRFLLISFLIGLLFNLPFKIYLKRKKRKKEIGNKLKSYCKKLILHTPIINCGILLLPHVVTHVFALTVLFSKNIITDDVERMVFQNFLYVSVVAAFLTLLFVYFWQKNRVHLKYIEFFFTEEELRKRVFRSKRGNIGRQLSMASFITTFFPMAIVVLYFVLSLTAVKDLKLDELTLEHKEVLLGNWNDSIGKVTDQGENNSFSELFYVTAIDSIVMFVGIGTGIFVSIFYLFLIVKWTT